MKIATLRADVLLLLTAIIWGLGFVAQKAGMETLGPYTYTAVRFLIATVSLLPLLLVLLEGAEHGQWILGWVCGIRRCFHRT